jgi:3'(2'), 5'-bisphosphate nucleotidase
LNREDVLAKLLEAAAAAARVVMRVYADSDLGIELKGPNDPVTRADKEANALLLERLEADFPGLPIVAEESDPEDYAGFASAPHVLFVDPVDGTRDFIARTGDFAVMLGLAEAGVATVGVIDCPARGEVYGGIVGRGGREGEAFCIRGGQRQPIRVSSATDLAACRCAVSRFQRSRGVNAKLEALGVRELVPVGSAGVKAVRIASGALEIYAHPSKGQVKLWDACAPDAIVRAAGGLYTDGTGRAFEYAGPWAQGEGTLAANPVLHAAALERWKP